VANSIEITQVINTEQVEQARQLIAEYISSLGIDLSFQNFAEEVAELPGCYAPPDGLLLLALVETQAAGCIGVRRLELDICEMKRLYVKPSFRSLGIGKSLVEAAINQARLLGYKSMRLDTLPQMLGAQKLYASLGFIRIEPYCFNPIEGTVFMELALNIEQN
jgi:ribosomal protein S18 acetylase RimI-like enzyme